jgi:hypothetical protein
VSIDASARVAYQGRHLRVEVSTDVFGTDAVRALLDVDDIHPLTTAASEPSTFELLDLAVALYVLDRSVQLRVAQVRRSFVLRLPVSDVIRWRRIVPLVGEWYEALTGDVVEVVPVDRGAAVGDHHRRASNFGFERGIDVVGLLSEGLDSLCGADGIARREERIALASVITNPKRSSQLETIKAALAAAHQRDLPHYALATRLRRQHKVREKSQRSRTVLALVTGMTIAHALGARRVECYENGFGLLNLPVPDLQYGSMSSQVLSPRHLPLWDRLSRAFFGPTIEVHFPNRYRTKAEMVRDLSEAGKRLVRQTSSCDRLLRLPDGILHCGTCGSCRYRQLAVALSGAVISDVPYAYRQVGKGPDTELVLRYHARMLGAALSQPDAWDALVRLQPEISNLPFSDDGRADKCRSENERRFRIRAGTLDVLRRHLDELQRWDAVRAA